MGLILLLVVQSSFLVAEDSIADIDQLLLADSINKYAA